MLCNPKFDYGRLRKLISWDYRITGRSLIFQVLSLCLGIHLRKHTLGYRSSTYCRSFTFNYVSGFYESWTTRHYRIKNNFTLYALIRFRCEINVFKNHKEVPYDRICECVMNINIQCICHGRWLSPYLKILFWDKAGCQPCSLCHSKYNLY